MRPVKSFLSLTLVLALSLSALSATFDPQACFGATPSRDLIAALKRASTSQKPVLVFVHDPKGGYNDQGLQIKYFTDLAETKKLLKDNFIVVLLPVGHKELTKYVAAGDNLERPMYFLIGPDGTLVKKDKAVANPADGLRIVKELVSMK
jgi:thioredoxin-related protein